jgi:hypothetical protein
MLEPKRFQDANESLNQINAWREEQEAKEIKQKLLLIERIASEYDRTARNGKLHTPIKIQKSGLW